jgi:hypothetical protein
MCPKCGSSDIYFGSVERSPRGVDGDWYEYCSVKCNKCGHEWEIVNKCSDDAGDDDTIPIRE